MSSSPGSAGGHRIAAAVRSNAVMFPLIGAVGFAANVAVARALSLSLFALYATAIALRATLQFLADFGTGQASSRLFAELQQQGARQQAWRLYVRLAWLRAAFVLVLVAVVLLFPEGVADVFGLASDERYFLDFIVLIGAAEVAGVLGHYLLVGTFEQRKLNRVLVVQGILQPVLVLSAAAADLGLRWILAGVLAGSVFKAVALNAFAIGTLRGFEQRSLGIAGLARSYTRVATSSIAGKVAGWVHSRQVVTVLALSTAGRPEVAVFALGYDLTTQVLTYAISPASGVVLPAFSVARHDERATARLFALTTRGVALLLLPVATTLLVVSSTLLPTVFGAAYADAVTYAWIFIPAIAGELILSIPASGLMLASDDLLRAYGRIKVVTATVGVAYLALALGAGLVVVAASMMAARLGSALALHVTVRRARDFPLVTGWLLRALGVAVGAGSAGAMAMLLVAGPFVELALAPVVCLVTFAVLMRLAGLLSAEETAAAGRLHPVAGRVLSVLARA